MLPGFIHWQMYARSHRAERACEAESACPLPDSIEVEGDVILVRRVLIYGVTNYAIISNYFT